MHNPQGVVHDPERCGQYFDCTLTNDNIALTSGVEKSAPNTLAESLPFLSSARSGDAGSVTSGVVTRAPSVTTGQEWIEYLVECPYPDLFSTQAGSCQDHRMVSCGEREEPKAPCKSVCGLIILLLISNFDIEIGPPPPKKKKKKKKKKNTQSLNLIVLFGNKTKCISPALSSLRYCTLVP